MATQLKAELELTIDDSKVRRSVRGLKKDAEERRDRTKRERKGVRDTRARSTRGRGFSAAAAAGVAAGATSRGQQRGGRGVIATSLAFVLK